MQQILPPACPPVALPPAALPTAHRSHLHEVQQLRPGVPGDGALVVLLQELAPRGDVRPAPRRDQQLPHGQRHIQVHALLALLPACRAREQERAAAQCRPRGTGPGCGAPGCVHRTHLSTAPTPAALVPPHPAPHPAAPPRPSTGTPQHSSTLAPQHPPARPPAEEVGVVVDLAVLIGVVHLRAQRRQLGLQLVQAVAPQLGQPCPGAKKGW